MRKSKKSNKLTTLVRGGKIFRLLSAQRKAYSTEEKLTKMIYTAKVEREWGRLVRDPYHLLEYNTTWKFLKKYLPKKGLILDAGGGPGRYTIELAKKSYDVVLLDFTPANLELAKKHIKKAKMQSRIKGVVEGSITNLSQFANNTFDAVLCLGGPLSHVHPENERKKAVAELIRVAKKNAPIFISVMGKLGLLARSLDECSNEIEMDKHFKEMYLQGNDYMWHDKAFAHSFEVEELKNLFCDKVKFIEYVGLEGLATPNKDKLNKLAKEKKHAYENWLEMHNKLCTHPTVVNSSVHFLVIARKK